MIAIAYFVTFLAGFILGDKRRRYVIRKWLGERITPKEGNDGKPKST
jgi:hypothetical protein